MSKIPKFESKLQLRSQQAECSTDSRLIKQRPYLRRSKSFDNLGDASAKSTVAFSKSNRKPFTNSSSTMSSITSRLKFVKEQNVDECPELPVIKKPARINMRRSKSFSDIRMHTKNFNLVTSANTNKTTVNVSSKSTQNGNSKSLKSGNTISKLNTARPNTKMNVIKAGTKRTGDNCDSEVKNKIMKKTKVPDWDYKTRFTILQEKYTTLQKDYKDVDSEITALKSNEESWKEQAMSLKKMNEELCRHKEDLENRYQQTRSELEHLKKEFSGLQNKYEQYYQESQNLSEEREHLLNEIFNGEKLRRKLHNCIQDLKGNIRVFCRLRPSLNEHEKINMCNFKFTDDNIIEIGKDRSSIAPGASMKCSEPQEFTFDKVFNQESTQAEIFEELSQLIQSAMDGYHVCVFAYGQTGSGKTYTMQGESDPTERLGMIPRSVQLIFNRKEEMQKKGWSYKIEASFLEIYNETVRDLMNMNSGKNLDIRYNEGKGTTVSNLTVLPIASAQELMDYMMKSQLNRSTAVTNFNEHSSRSHAVTKIYIEARYKDSDDIYVGSVSLVDLAGSESAKSVSNARLAETKNINKSLSCLGNVMMALYKKESHIPYRNSKLTFLLQSSLGGNCKCLMVVNISPCNDSYNESVNALRFAAKVKEVKIASSKNKLLVTPSK